MITAIQQLIVIAIMFVVSPTTLPPASESTLAAERRAREIAAVTATGSRAEAGSYIESNFSKELRKVPAHHHIANFLSLHDASGGYDVLRVERADAGNITVRVKNKLTGRTQGLSVQVEDTAPYKVLNFRIVPAEPAAPEVAKRTAVRMAAKFNAFVTGFSRPRAKTGCRVTG